MDWSCLLRRWFVPKRSYVEDIIANKWRWREEGIVNEQPIRKLAKPLLKFGQWFYFVFGVLQLVFMVTFSAIHIPDWTSCSSRLCDQNATTSVPTADQGYPNWFWLVWPSILLLYNGYMYSASVYSEIRHVVFVVQSKSDYLSWQESLGRKAKVPTLLLLATIDRLPPCGYPVALFIWFHAHHSWRDDPHYYQVEPPVVSVYMYPD